jgi:hypothetical protein
VVNHNPQNKRKAIIETDAKGQPKTQLAKKLEIQFVYSCTWAELVKVVFLMPNLARQIVEKLSVIFSYFAWIWHDLQTVCAVQKCSVVHWSLMLWQPLQLPPIKWGSIVDEQVRLHCLMWHQNLLYLTANRNQVPGKSQEPQKLKDYNSINAATRSIPRERAIYRYYEVN